MLIIREWMIISITSKSSFMWVFLLLDYLLFFLAFPRFHLVMVWLVTYNRIFFTLTLHQARVENSICTAGGKQARSQHMLVQQTWLFTLLEMFYVQSLRVMRSLDNKSNPLLTAVWSEAISFDPNLRVQNIF